MDSFNICRKFPDLCPKPVANKRDNKLSIKLLAVFGNEGEEVIVITADDRVYGFGANRFGRLGLGVNGLIARPQLNATLTGKKITKICYGLGHCIGLTRSGQCYGWGHNSCGQIGIGSVADTPTPQPIKILSNTKQPKQVKAISCGDNHTLALTNDGMIYSFGANDRRQCGQTEGEMVWTASIVKIKAKFVSISCGRNHSAGLTDRKTVYVWGSNDCQQLGPKALVVAGQTYCCPHPFYGHNLLVCRTVLCGLNHTVLLALPGIVYAYGSYDWKPDLKSGHLFAANNVCPKQRFKWIDTTYDNRVVIVTATYGQRYYLGKANGSITFTPIDIPMKSSLFAVFAKYCGFDRTFASIVQLIETSMSSPKSCSQNDEEIYWSEGEDADEAIGLQTTGSRTCDPKNTAKSGSTVPVEAVKKHLSPQSGSNSDTEIYLSEGEEPEDGNDVTIEDIRLDAGDMCHKSSKSNVNAMKSTLCLTGGGDNAKNAGTIEMKTTDSIDPIMPCSENNLFANEESIQSMNNCSESDEEIYLSDPEDNESYTTGTIDSKNTNCCDPIVGCFQKHLFKVFNNRLDFDLRFIVENKSIYCHKTVLKIRNKEFWEICEQNMINERDIEINAYSYDTINSFLMFLYGLRPEVNDQNCTELLELAEDYGERGLQEMCQNSN